MKTQKHHFSPCPAAQFGLWIAVSQLILQLPGAAAQSAANYAATGTIIHAPAPPIFVTNASGQVAFRGSVQSIQVLSDDARLTGRRLVIMEGASQPGGSMVLTGSAYHESGTWDAAGSGNATFTPDGGFWEISLRGNVDANNVLNVHAVGSGTGGKVEGLRLDENMTAGACTEIPKPGCEFHYAGAVLPQPVNSTDVIDNFDDNQLRRWETWNSGTQSALFETNSQLTVRGYWPGPRTTVPSIEWAKGLILKKWSIADGQTLEYRVDVVKASDTASIVKPDIWSQAAGLGYNIAVGTNFVAVMKWLHGFAVLSCERAYIPRNNVTLALAMTRFETNLVLTARILDMGDPEKVLYQRVVIDTPLADPALSPAQFMALTAMDAPVISDKREAPLFSGDSIDLEVFQYTNGTRQPAVVVFDNVELRTYETPPVIIERAIRLNWQAPGSLTFRAEGSPSVDGPWLPIQDSMPTGLMQVTVPASESMKYFRLRRGP